MTLYEFGACVGQGVRRARGSAIRNSSCTSYN